MKYKKGQEVYFVFGVGTAGKGLGTVEEVHDSFYTISKSFGGTFYVDEDDILGLYADLRVTF